MPEGSWDYEPVETVVDSVTCELMLETARTCRDLLAAVERIEAEITRRRELSDGSDPASPEGSAAASDRGSRAVVREMRRIELFARAVPSILDPGRLICLGDMAADRPDWWRVNRLHFFDPELTRKQIAELTGLHPHQVRDAIHAVEIPAECYENLPEIK
jgi:hypothetical protein